MKRRDDKKMQQCPAATNVLLLEALHRRGSFVVQYQCIVDATKTNLATFAMPDGGLGIEARRVAGLEELQHNQLDNFTFDERPQV